MKTRNLVVVAGGEPPEPDEIEQLNNWTKVAVVIAEQSAAMSIQVLDKCSEKEKKSQAGKRADWSAINTSGRLIVQ